MELGELLLREVSRNYRIHALPTSWGIAFRMRLKVTGSKSRVTICLGVTAYINGIRCLFSSVTLTSTDAILTGCMLARTQHPHATRKTETHMSRSKRHFLHNLIRACQMTRFGPGPLQFLSRRDKSSVVCDKEKGSSPNNASRKEVWQVEAD